MKLKDLFEKPISGEWGTDIEEGSVGFKVIRTTNFTNLGRLNLTNVVERNIDFVKHQNKILKFGDLIVEKSGGSPTQPVGRVVIFEENNKEVYFCNNFTSILRPNEKIIPKFGLYLLKDLYNKKKVLKFQNKTTGIINLKINDYLNATDISIPNINIQNKIVKALDKAQYLIDKRKEQIEALDELIKSVFYDMFGDIVKSNWIKKNLTEITTKDKYSIKRGPFGGALKKECFKKYGYLVYEQYHAIHDDYTMARYFIDDKKFEELKAFEVKAGDLIVSCSGVTLGRISEIPKNSYKGIINQALLKITLDYNIMNNEFFKFLFKSSQIQNILFKSSRGSGIPNFPPMATIKSIEFICPPIELQNKFANIVEKIESEKTLLQQSLSSFEENFNSLMQRAFNGELFSK